MIEILEDEYELFLEAMKNNVSFCRYLDETDYEDEYSHSEIHAGQSKLINKIRTWIRKNKPNQYVVSSSFCIFVMSIEEAKKRNIINWESRVV